jgi:hypothetical protein
MKAPPPILLKEKFCMAFKPRRRRKIGSKKRRNRKLMRKKK